MCRVASNRNLYIQFPFLAKVMKKNFYQANMENNLAGSFEILTTLNSFSSLIYLKSSPWKIPAQYVC